MKTQIYKFLDKLSTQSSILDGYLFVLPVGSFSYNVVKCKLACINLAIKLLEKLV